MRQRSISSHLPADEKATCGRAELRPVRRAVEAEDVRDLAIRGQSIRRIDGLGSELLGFHRQMRVETGGRRRTVTEVRLNQSCRSSLEMSRILTQ